MAAKVVDRPVKLVLSREGVLRVVGDRTPSEQTVALGASEEGKRTSMIHIGVTARSFANDFAEQFSFLALHRYATENLLIQQKVVSLNTTANTFMRAERVDRGEARAWTAYGEECFRSTTDGRGRELWSPILCATSAQKMGTQGSLTLELKMRQPAGTALRRGRRLAWGIFLAQAQGFGCDLDQLVFRDELDCLLQIHQLERHQADGIVGACYPHAEEFAA